MSVSFPPIISTYIAKRKLTLKVLSFGKLFPILLTHPNTQHSPLSRVSLELSLQSRRVLGLTQGTLRDLLPAWCHIWFSRLNSSLVLISFPTKGRGFTIIKYTQRNVPHIWILLMKKGSPECSQQQLVTAQWVQPCLGKVVLSSKDAIRQNLWRRPGNYLLWSSLPDFVLPHSPFSISLLLILKYSFWFVYHLHHCMAWATSRIIEWNRHLLLSLGFWPFSGTPQAGNKTISPIPPISGLRGQQHWNLYDLISTFKKQSLHIKIRLPISFALDFHGNLCL